MPRGKARPDQSHVPVVASIPAPQLPLGYQQITDVSTVQALTVPAGACLAVVQSEGAAIRWRDDGVNPSATVGMRVLVNSELRYDGNLTTIRFLQEGSGAKLNVSYYG